MRRPRIFWGWYVVAASVALAAYNSGLFVYGFTAFINPIEATFGWSRARISFATSLLGLESGAIAPFLGMVIDRWPARRLVFTGVILWGCGALWISQASSLSTFYIGFLVVGLGSSLGISLVPQTAVVKWFKRDLGKAAGVVTMGMGISGALIPIVIRLIDALGWQKTLLFLGCGMWLFGVPLSFVFRSRPEDYGLLPDGKPDPVSEGTSGRPTYEFSTGVPEALRTRAFWHIGVASAIQMGCVMAVATHVIPYFTGIGIERSTAGTVAMLVPLISLFARFPFGWLCDVFTKKYVMALALGMKCVGLILFWLIGHGYTGLIVVFVIFFGLGSGGMTPPRTPILREYFGVRRFGTIFGIASVFVTVGLVTTPPLAGWVFDTIGTYLPVWFGLAIAALLGVVVLVTMPLPRARAESAG